MAIRTMVREMGLKKLSRYGEASRLDREFLDRYKANQRSTLEDSGDRRASSYREAFPASKVASGIAGTRARHRDFVEMVTILSAQSALADILTGLVSNVQLRVGVQRGEALVPSWYCPDLLSAIYLDNPTCSSRRANRSAFARAELADKRSFRIAGSKSTAVILAGRTPETIAKSDTTLTPPGAQHPATSVNHEIRKTLELSICN